MDRAFRRTPIHHVYAGFQYSYASKYKYKWSVLTA